jgi:predicted RNA-binding protein with PIN domain
MKLLIDGYNLLHASGIFGPSGEGDLHGSRMALLEYLASRLTAPERTETTVVFDAKDAPPGLPRQFSFREITVRFAADHPQADDLIELLIDRSTQPRQLTVVSSDRRLLRAARRRRATGVGSRQWLRQLESGIGQGDKLAVKPQAGAATQEVREWLEAFGALDPAEMQDLSEPPIEVSLEKVDESDEAKRRAMEDQELKNPFPPGYGQDLPDD